VAKIKLTGINTTRKKLSDGSVRIYHYHRGTGAPLPGKKGSPEFLTAYLEAEKLAPISGNVAALIRDYLLSRKFEFTKDGSRRPESTKKEYRRLLAKAESEFGTLPIKALESPKVNDLFITWHEEIALDSPREADNRVTVLGVVFAEAKRRGKIVRNPLERFEKAYVSDRSEMIWTEADITRFMRGAPVELQRALILAIHTGQRYGDLIRLRWCDFDGKAISLKQSKTSVRVWVPCTAALHRMLEQTPRVGPYILTRADGRPWFTDRDGSALSKAWPRQMEAAGFYPRPFAELTKAEKAGFLHFNDMRGTAVTLLSEAKCTPQLICAITGHTLQSATRILERYLAMTDALSSAAIHLFENAPETAFANRLQTTSKLADKTARKTEGKQ
jgi:integrase